MVKREPITIRAETGDLAEHDRGHHRVMTELLARMNIREMNLDRRSANSRQCIAQGNAVVCKRRGVDDDAHRRRAERLNRVDQNTLVVRLHVLDPQWRIGATGRRREVRHDLGESCAPVYAGFPGAEQVEVWAIEDEHVVVPGLFLR